MRTYTITLTREQIEMRAQELARLTGDLIDLEREEEAQRKDHSSVMAECKKRRLELSNQINKFGRAVRLGVEEREDDPQPKLFAAAEEREAQIRADFGTNGDATTPGFFKTEAELMAEPPRRRASDHPEDLPPPPPIEAGKLELEAMAKFSCSDKIANRQPVKLWYDETASPHVITGSASGPAGYERVDVWSVLPEEIAGKEIPPSTINHVTGYRGVRVKVGKKTWVIVGPERKYVCTPEQQQPSAYERRRAEAEELPPPNWTPPAIDEFTAPKCAECGRIDGAHDVLCPTAKVTLENIHPNDILYWRKGRAIGQPVTVREVKLKEKCIAIIDQDNAHRLAAPHQLSRIRSAP